MIFVATINGGTSGILDPGWIKIRIRDKHPGSATLRHMYMCAMTRTYFFTIVDNNWIIITAGDESCSIVGKIWQKKPMYFGTYNDIGIRYRIITQRAFWRKVRKRNQIEITHTIVTLVRTFVYMFIAIRCIYNNYIQKIMYILPLHVFTRMWMRSSRVVSIRLPMAKSQQPGFEPSILWHSGIWGASDAAVFIEKYIHRTGSQKIPLLQRH